MEESLLIQMCSRTFMLVEQYEMMFWNRVSEGFFV